MSGASVAEVTAFGKELFGAARVECRISASWLAVALGRDGVGDFARGMGRLPGILERVGSGELGRRLELGVGRPSALSVRVSAPAGHWPDQVGQSAAALAVDVAAEHGVGLAAFPKPHVVGATLKPVVESGMLGAVFVQNRPFMNHPGVADRNLVGNNPFACCAPGDPPFLFDGALSQHSLFGLLDAAKIGEDLPENAVLDANGGPSRDPEIVERLYGGDTDRGSLAPLGGVRGLGLAMCAEFLAGALTGGFHDPPPGKPWGEGALVVVFDPGLFGEEDVDGRARRYLEQFGRYPGLRAQEAAGVRAHLEYPEQVLTDLNAAAERFGVGARLPARRTR